MKIFNTQVKRNNSSLRDIIHISIEKSMFSICRIVKCKITIDCINFQNFSCIV